MNLNDVLLQQREIKELLQKLQVRHRELLNSTSDDNSSLNRVRKDILICLNDLKTLNGMMIDSKNGLLREELDALGTYSKKLEDLASKKALLDGEFSSWSSKPTSDLASLGSWESISIGIKGNHRAIMNSYIAECGIENLSLGGIHPGEDTSFSNHELTAAEPERKKILENIAMLNLCRDQVSSEIDQLKSLIREYEKDKKLLESELDSNERKVVNKVTLIQREKTNILAKQRKILKKLGIFKEPERNSYFSFGDNLTSSEADFDIALSQAHDFIEAKKDALQELLRDSKKEASSLATQFTYWRDSIMRIQALETSLQELFIARNGDISKDEVVAMIYAGIDQVADSMDLDSDDAFASSLNDELEALKQAICELNAVTDKSPVNFPVKQPDMLNLGTSPPKVQISMEVIAQQKHTPSGSVYKIDKAD